MLGAYVTLAVVTNVVDNFWLAVVAGALAVGVSSAPPSSLRRSDRCTTGSTRISTSSSSRLIRPRDPRGGPIHLGIGVVLDRPARRVQLLGGTRRSTFSAYRLVVIGLAVAVLVSLAVHHADVLRLWCGHFSDRELASMLGVDVPRLYTGVFSRACSPASAARSPTSISPPGARRSVIIDAFIVVVIGGARLHEQGVRRRDAHRDDAEPRPAVHQRRQHRPVPRDGDRVAVPS